MTTSSIGCEISRGTRRDWPSLASLEPRRSPRAPRRSPLQRSLPLRRRSSPPSIAVCHCVPRAKSSPPPIAARHCVMRTKYGSGCASVASSSHPIIWSRRRCHPRLPTVVTQHSAPQRRGQQLRRARRPRRPAAVLCQTTRVTAQGCRKKWDMSRRERTAGSSHNNSKTWPMPSLSLSSSGRPTRIG